LEAKSGPAVKNEIYYFKDKGNRLVGLRFDLTVGITRYVASKRELSRPVRLGAYSSVWRYDEPQYGRYRWFYQWDAELFGPSNPEADAEIIEFSSSLFNRLGTNPLITVGSRKILEAYIRNECGIEEESKLFDMLRAIDKLSKKSKEQISQEYFTSFSKNQLEQVSKFAELKGEPEKVAAALSEFKVDPMPLLQIIDALKARGVRDVTLNLGVVRGIDYYTDMVFEAIDGDNPRLGSLCGGGRYDSLPRIYERPDLGATGVAGGVERAVLAYKFKKEDVGRVFIAPVGKDERIKVTASSIAADLRREGIPAQSEITGRSLRKTLESESALGTKAVVIVGETELRVNSVKVKWLKSGEESMVRISE
ncbi:MAG: histidine--tRNA ligase, partial [Nitrososphaerales archaeon]